MENAEINAVKIADFLENKMQPEEEKAFMTALSSDDALRQQYEEELLINSLISEGTETSSLKNNLLFQPADEHIHMIESAIEKKAAPEKNTALLRTLYSYRKIAAIALLFISGMVVFLLIKSRPERSNDISTIQPAEKKVTVAQISTPPKVAKNTDLDSIFKVYYNPYAGKNDPVEVSNLLAYYESGKHELVIKATDGDLQQMGTSDSKDLLKNYLHFYKGLAYLAEGDAPNAIEQFDPIASRSKNTAPPFFDAQWYYALSMLKVRDVEKTTAILKNVIQSNSPYKQNATKLLQQLNQ